MKTQFGYLITGDLSEGTLTIEIGEDIEIQAGKYAIVPIDEYNRLINGCNSEVKTVSVESQIEDLIKAKYGYSFKDLSVKSRKSEILEARQVSMYLLMEYTELSTNDIGEIFNRDHATVLHSKKVVSDLSYSDVSYRNNIERLEEKLNNKL